jgi:membrane protein implicated in regulation of membrane protease activity
LNKWRLAVCLIAVTLILTASCLVLIPTGFVLAQSSATTTTAVIPEMPSGVLYALVVAVVATVVVTATVVTRLRNRSTH